MERRRSEVNDLNVFPVADGDTGDNMAMTMRAVLDELDRMNGQPIDDIGRDELVAAVARSALLGARGNSGVILSQIVRGAAEELASRRGELVDPLLVSAAFARAADAAYDSVRDPAEGTMLTAIRAMARRVAHDLAHMDTQRLGPDAADAEQDRLLAQVLENALEAAKEAVERGPEQLAVLREAGSVVPRLEEIGDSVLVVGDQQTLRVHVHTDEPDLALAIFEAVGEVSRLDVADMHEQVADRAGRLDDDPDRGEEAVCGIVAVASGEGLRRLYEELGAYVVDGGPTMNPSTYELLAGIHEVHAAEVLVLPNSPNVILAAERAAELSERPARVVHTTAPQEGLAALLGFDPGRTGEQNAATVAEEAASLRLGGVAPAARDDPQGRFRAGEAVGYANGELAAWGDPAKTLAATIARLAARSELLTCIAGDHPPEPREVVERAIPEGVELDYHEGGQPAWWWLLCAE